MYFGQSYHYETTYSMQNNIIDHTPTKFLVMAITKKFRKPFPACGTFQAYYNFSTHRISASTFSSFVAQPVQNRTQLCVASIRWS